MAYEIERFRPANRSLAVFQVGSSFPETVANGSEAILLPLLKSFSKMDLRTVVYSVGSGGGDAFQLYPRVSVARLLPENFVYPEAGAAPFQLATVVGSIRRAIDAADTVYIHGSGLHFDSSVLEGRRATVCVQDVSYASSVMDALAFAGHRLVTVSTYARDCLRELLRLAGAPCDVGLTPNGYSAEQFGPRDPARLRSDLGLTPDTVALLYPHRAEASKGLRNAFEALLRLVDEMPRTASRRLALLVPLSKGGAFAARNRAARELARDMGVEGLVHFHDRLPLARMAEYYSLGAATFCVGASPESFGNVHIESSLAGTPAIVSRVGAQRTALPDELVRKVDPGNVDELARHLLEVLGGQERVSPDTQEYIRRNYDLGTMIKAYHSEILSPRSEPCHTSEPPSGRCHPDSVVRIPPWCAVLETGYYNDFVGYTGDPKLLSCIRELERPARAGEIARKYEIGYGTFERWFMQGHILV